MTRHEAGRMIGSMNKGERNPRAKLTEREAREVLSSSEKYEDLAQRLNISVSSVAFIKTRRRWKHLDEQ